MYDMSDEGRHASQSVSDKNINSEADDYQDGLHYW